MTVIRTLDLSETDEQREREKLKIEKEFKKSDLCLNEVNKKKCTIKSFLMVSFFLARIS